MLEIHYTGWIAIVSVLLLSLSMLENRLAYAGYILAIVSAVLYVLSFLINDFTLLNVFLTSSKELPISLKFVASWSTSSGFLVWCYLVYALLALFTKKTNRVFVITCVLLVLSAFLEGAYYLNRTILGDGLSLDHTFRNIYAILHPFFTFLSYAFCLYVALLATQRYNIGLRILRLAYLFLSLANVMGAVWAYFTLGWGGFWGWDPVEVSLLIPWLVFTSYWHVRDKSVLSLLGFFVGFSACFTRIGVSTLHWYGLLKISPASYVFIIIVLIFAYYIYRNYRSKVLELLKLYDERGVKFGGKLLLMLAILYAIAIIFTASFGRTISPLAYMVVTFVILTIILVVTPNENVKSSKKSITVVLFITAVSFIFGWLVDITRESAPNLTSALILGIVPPVVYTILKLLSGRKVIIKDNVLLVMHVLVGLIIVSFFVAWPFAFYESWEYKICQSHRYYEKPIEYLNVHGLKIPNVIAKETYTTCDGLKVKFTTYLYVIKALKRPSEAIYTDPVIVNDLLGQYYLVIPSNELEQLDLIVWSIKVVNKYSPTIAKHLATQFSLNYSKVLEKNISCFKNKPTMILLRYIPFVNLLWLCLIGFVLTIILRIIY